MSNSGFILDFGAFLFFSILGVVLLLIGGGIGIFFIMIGKIFLRIIGLGVIGITLLFSLFMFSSAFNSFSDDSVKGTNDIEQITTLIYDRSVMVKDMIGKSTPSTLYVYFRDDGTEIGLTKKQHEYVQKYTSNSEFRIFYRNNPSPRQYDYETSIFGEDKPGIPLFEAKFVKIIE